MRHKLPILAVLAVTGVLMFSICGALFRCGCRALWSGAAEHCNVHAAQGPRCPWCEHPVLGAAGFALTAGGQVLAYVLARRGGASPRAATGVAAAALPRSALLAGAATWLLTDYPHFLVPDARDRLSLLGGPIPSRAPVTEPRAGAGSPPAHAPDPGRAP
ncbi:MAG TPA: hypothetical protein VLI67_05295 [Vicinamibacteria bacterium]|nr:hypothetical protein [Vicinamibacteria bacterium]